MKKYNISTKDKQYYFNIKPDTIEVIDKIKVVAKNFDLNSTIGSKFNYIKIKKIDFSSKKITIRIKELRSVERKQELSFNYFMKFVMRHDDIFGWFE